VYSMIHKAMSRLLGEVHAYREFVKFRDTHSSSDLTADPFKPFYSLESKNSIYICVNLKASFGLY
jgi:hypothetical protein